MPGPAASYPPSYYTPEVARAYVSNTLIQNYINYAVATLLVYELLTTLDDEIARVWSLKWRLPKILFMLNRYFIRGILIALWILADFPGTSPEFCRIYSYWQMIPLRLAIIAAQGLVVIRVWAIYNNSRFMWWILTILYTLECLVMAACIIVATADTQGIAQPAPLSCGLHSRSGYLLKMYASGTWIAPVCFEFIMLLITLAKVVPRWKLGGRKAGQWGILGSFGTGGNDTLDVLARDSLVYFLFIFTFSLTNVIIYEFDFSAYFRAVLLGPTSAISCIAVSRMMINIRSLPSSALDHPTTVGRVELSFMETGDDEDHAPPRPNVRTYQALDSDRPSGRHASSAPYAEGGIPDSATTPGFPAASQSAPPALLNGGYSKVVLVPASTEGAESQRTSVEGTRIGLEEDDIEMDLRKILTPPT
ncbi:unnamed protein product [Mycena citricolor]|uniref:DUF6533 domain-containing protein n=1 Tax=Mycena citricolor TaxID=2018698 RepID=A0AAD2JV62_9AGAR|nr:unnamed protein product [Mycena citricolor]CAK5278442.1 unnamed protein product [Mycena citricolor]CAK5278451.1 unnamed protein product [Mycena citricolor]